MKFNHFFFFLGLILTVSSNLLTSSDTVPDKHFVFIIPSYNNAQFYKMNLDSVFNQAYPHFRVIYIDDCSDDGTADLVEEYIKMYHLENKMTLIRNTECQFALSNTYMGAHMCADGEVLCFLDGDDALAQYEVLSMLNELYKLNPNIWMTYGNSIRSDGSSCSSMPIDESIIAGNSYRDFAWVTLHMRTSYAWLFKMICLEDLMYQGRFFSAACDCAYGYPLLELTGGRFVFVNNILHIYNVHNPINVHKGKELKQKFLAEIVHNRRRYKSPNRRVDIGSYMNALTPYALLVFSENNPSQLQNFLEDFMQNQEYNSAVYVLYSATKPQDYVRYGKLVNEFPEVQFIPYNDANCAIEKLIEGKSHPFYLMCSDTWKNKNSSSVQEGLKLLKQTRAFIFSLMPFSKRKEKTRYAFISDEVCAYQLGWPSFEYDNDNCFSYLVSRTNLIDYLQEIMKIIKSNLIFPLEEKGLKEKVILTYKKLK